MRHFPQETFEKFRRVIPRTMKFWQELGIDVSQQKIECTPHWGISSASGQGGVKIDEQCQSSIPGLFAAGAVARNPIAGIYAVGGVPTSSCNVMGYIAGENAARYSSEIKEAELDLQQVQELSRTAASPLQVNNGLSPADLFTSLNRLVMQARFGMFKHQRRILQVLKEIERLKESLAKVSAPDYHELVKANEVKNYLLGAEMVFRAALEREESRQYHYREDYPYRDDVQWLKLVIFRKEAGGLSVRHEPLPMDRWPIKPQRQSKISHPIQVFLGE
jgi:succinate dehydrogenase/fumarate reductase flavoprotein subunit